MLNTLIMLVMTVMGPRGSMMKHAKIMWMEMGINALVEDAALQKDLGLSQEQISKIKDLKFSTDKEVVRLRSDMELKEIDLREELSKDSPDMNRVKNLIKAKHSIMAEIELAKVKEYIGVKNILTPEQIEKFKTVMRNRAKRSMKNRMRDRRLKNR